MNMYIVFKGTTEGKGKSLHSTSKKLRSFPKLTTKQKKAYSKTWDNYIKQIKGR